MGLQRRDQLCCGVTNWILSTAYLELAQRRGLALASLDGALRAAAKDEDVALLGI